ncbi:lipocalin family protein [Bacteroides ovatus]|uniref:Lipocalin-like n=1 Tax=Bacteroides ovatus TaxID=28116 RepID=A0A1G8M602_BACOV|nr:lipocalin family protein [Bacteroides ovatus]SDI63368.1 Lipocalin-like [Bacteroides ovatus]
MKKLLITVIALSCFAFSSYGQDKVEKQIIGKWCNPYTYESTGELKGFEFEKGGKCSAVNIPSLDLKTWKVDKDGYLIVEGFSKGEDGKMEVYKTRERISYVTSDSLELVVQEASPRLAFLYLNMKSIKKLVTSEATPNKK